MSARDVLVVAAIEYGEWAAKYGTAHRTWMAAYPDEADIPWRPDDPPRLRPHFDKMVAPAMARMQLAQDALRKAARRLYDGASYEYADHVPTSEGVTANGIHERGQVDDNDSWGSPTADSSAP